MGVRQDTIQVGTVFKLLDGRIKVVTRNGDTFESPHGSENWPTIEIYYDRGTVSFSPGVGREDS